MKLKRFAGDKVIYIAAAVILIALAILMLPFIGISEEILHYVIAGCILVYLLTYLLGRLKKSRKTILALTIVEFVLMALIALGLVLQELQVMGFLGDQVCVILGFGMACRGTVEMFRAYYYQSNVEHSENSVSAARKTYPIWEFVANLVVLIFGVYITARPFITNEAIIWIVIAIAAIAAIVCIVLGVVCIKEDSKGGHKERKPKKEKKNKKKEQEKEEDQQ